eukprot:Polyplicarium_translucidae@DN2761_c0_g1_i4.p1
MAAVNMQLTTATPLQVNQPTHRSASSQAVGSRQLRSAGQPVVASSMIARGHGRHAGTPSLGSARACVGDSGFTHDRMPATTANLQRSVSLHHATRSMDAMKHTGGRGRQGTSGFYGQAAANRLASEYTTLDGSVSSRRADVEGAQTYRSTCRARSSVTGTAILARGPAHVADCGGGSNTAHQPPLFSDEKVGPVGGDTANHAARLKFYAPFEQVLHPQTSSGHQHAATSRAGMTTRCEFFQHSVPNTTTALQSTAWVPAKSNAGGAKSSPSSQQRNEERHAQRTMSRASRPPHCEAAATEESFVRALAKVYEELVRVSRCSPGREGESRPTRFHAIKAPDISIRDYLERIHKYFACSNECFVLSLIYIDRIIKLHDRFAICLLNIHRLMITSVMLATKFFDDVYYSNAFYARVGGVKTREINLLESHFLSLINYQLFVSPREYDKYRKDVLFHAGVGITPTPPPTATATATPAVTTADRQGQASGTTGTGTGSTARREGRHVA